MKKLLKLVGVAAVALMITACGERVEVPPAHVGKVMTKDGYQDTVIPSSKFRLPACLMYCDRLVLLDVADKAYNEDLTIFIPEDKLNLNVRIRTTLSVDPRKTEELFGALAPSEVKGSISSISSQSIYATYASQIVQAEVREYLSQFSIGEIASSNERVNQDLRERLTKALQQRTPFSVRYVGLTNIAYPKIITDAQEAAAERREAIQQENAQLEISKVKLERELQEARLNRAIEKEKAETEAMAQRLLADSVDSRVLELRRLENERLWIERWSGTLPATVLGDAVPMFNIGK